MKILTEHLLYIFKIAIYFLLSTTFETNVFMIFNSEIELKA